MDNILSLYQGKFVEQLGKSSGNSNLWQLCAALRLALIGCILLIYNHLLEISSRGCATVPNRVGSQTAVKRLSSRYGESK
jgi:hypothetical protein